MHSVPRAEQAVRLAESSARQWICQSCRAGLPARTFHTSATSRADIPFYQRMRNTIFGTKQEDEAAKRRNEEVQKRAADQHGRKEEAQSQGRTLELERKTDQDGRIYEVAALVDPSVDKDYVASGSWTGLESIGGDRWARKQGKHNMVKYKGNKPKPLKQLNPQQWQALLTSIARRAGVVQHKADSKSHSRTKKADSQSPNEQVVEDLGAGSATWDRLSAQSLPNTSVNFKIAEMIYESSGKRLPDAVASTASTLNDFYKACCRVPTRQRLAASPQLQALKASAPNVSVYAKRRTPIDKETAVGRWKVIESELLARGLPVTGTQWTDAKPFLPKLIYGPKKQVWKQSQADIVRSVGDNAPSATG